jgi:hypothetical protein
MLSGVLLGTVSPAHAQVIEVPPENRAIRSEAPSRPPESEVQACGQRLFAAVVRDAPTMAADCFFPRAAFIQVKAMARPERYYDRLYRRFEADVHSLHRELNGLERAAFLRLELGRRGGWVRPGEEGNRLPYWAARHAMLHYSVDGQPRKFEVRVLISWGTRWYFIHVREFR